MLYLAFKNALYRPARLLLTILAVAAILAEILILEGFLAGSYKQMRQAVLWRDADVIVAQSGISNFLVARSILPQQTRAEVKAVKGVKTTYPLTSLMLIYEKAGRLSPIIILVYDDAGGPHHITKGAPPTRSGDIVIDRSLAQRYGLKLGDTLTLSDFDFTISGISEGGAALFTPFAFISYDSLIDFYFSSDVADDISTFPLLSFLGVKVTDDANPADVVKRISASVSTQS